MLPPLNLELTLSQKFEIEKIKKDLDKVSKEDLQQICLDLIKQKYCIQNAFNNLIKDIK